MITKNVMLTKNYKFLIGIDTGTRTGLCIWNSEVKEIHYVATMPIHQAMDIIREYQEVNEGEFFVRLEDARLRKWIPQAKNEKGERGRREGAGSVKRDAAIWEDFLTDLGVPFELVAPKNNTTKLSETIFQKMTGCKIKTSEHARDAAMLVVGF